MNSRDVPCRHFCGGGMRIHIGFWNDFARWMLARCREVASVGGVCELTLGFVMGWRGQD